MGSKWPVARRSASIASISKPLISKSRSCVRQCPVTDGMRKFYVALQGKLEDPSIRWAISSLPTHQFFRRRGSTPQPQSSPLYTMRAVRRQFRQEGSVSVAGKRLRDTCFTAGQAGGTLGRTADQASKAGYEGVYHSFNLCNRQIVPVLLQSAPG